MWQGNEAWGTCCTQSAAGVIMLLAKQQTLNMEMIAFTHLDQRTFFGVQPVTHQLGDRTSLHGMHFGMSWCQYDIFIVDFIESWAAT